MKHTLSLALAIALVSFPYQANTQEKPADPKCALVLYCVAVVVVVVVAGVVFYYVKNTCDNLFNNPGFTNRLDTTSLTMPPLISSMIGYGTTTVEIAAGAGEPWGELFSVNLQQRIALVVGQPNTVTATMFKDGVPVATNSALCYSNGQSVVIDFRGSIPDTNAPSAGVFRLVN